MKRKYYKLNLEDTIYYRGEFNELNHIYFNKISDNEYEERLSNIKVFVNGDKVYLPTGIIFDISKFTPTSSIEVLTSFDTLKKNNLNREYYQIILNLLQNIPYIEEEKNNSDEMKKIL